MIINHNECKDRPFYHGAFIINLTMARWSTHFLLILILYAYCPYCIEFGIKTPNISNGVSGTSEDTINMTLYWKTISFECNIKPILFDTYYSCNSIYSKSVPISSKSSIYNNTYGLQIINTGTDGVEIEQIIVRYVSLQNTTIELIFEYFCFNVPSTQYHPNHDKYIVQNHCINSKYQGYSRIVVDSDDSEPYILFEFDKDIIFNNQNVTKLEAYINHIINSSTGNHFSCYIYLFEQNILPVLYILHLHFL